MDDESINAVVAELKPSLVGRVPGKIFQLGPSSLAIDFGLRQQGYLLINVEPAAPRLYLIKSRVRDLEKQSTPPTQFAQALRKALSGTRLVSAVKDPVDRIVRFEFAGADDLGIRKSRTLIAQLTGRSANLLLLDADKTIIQSLRASRVSRQATGETYRKPEISRRGSPQETSELLNLIRSQKFPSASEAADAYFTSLFAEKDFAARANAARANLRKKISQQQKLLKQLEVDLQSHAGGEQQKRIGDLLLANLSTAKRDGNRVTLIDYFAADASPMTVEIDESVSLQEAAARRFRLYSRSKRALAQITSRIASVRAALRQLQTKQESLEKLLAEPRVIASWSEARATTRGLQSSAQRTFESGPVAKGRGRDLSSEPAFADARDKPKRIPGTRSYLSSDGFEILVGRTSRDNDQLTFKVSKPNDLWLHAADYRGSHVVVRNTTRKPIPHRTLIEAAQLAAYFSQAKKDPKVDVHHTERKFVSKPKGAKPGLVRLQRFKNITVQPKEAGTRV